MKNECIICKNHTFKKIINKVRDSDKHKILKCNVCSHVQLSPIPSPQEDKIFYDKNKQFKNQNYKINLKEREMKSLTDTQRRISLISKFTKKNSKILEIGSGYGFLLKHMKNLGYDITGIEVSAERRKISRKITKAPILSININDENFPVSKKFDMILLFQVLEHISTPIKFLSNIQKFMKPNAKIIIEVPNIDDHQLKINQSYNNWFWQRAHLNYFSPNSLKKVLQLSNFKKNRILGIQRHSIENLFYWKFFQNPQLKNTSYNSSYEILDNFYKKSIEKNFTSDTIIGIGNFIK
jgi:2-polyprenyl-3-methyl-5-hydroxy-6-metoxy-1,4-benzoquinol methylase